MFRFENTVHGSYLQLPSVHRPRSNREADVIFTGCWNIARLVLDRFSGVLVVPHIVHILEGLFTQRAGKIIYLSAVYLRCIENAIKSRYVKICRPS